jgi:hypothetical protein
MLVACLTMVLCRGDSRFQKPICPAVLFPPHIHTYIYSMGRCWEGAYLYSRGDFSKYIQICMTLFERLPAG